MPQTCEKYLFSIFRLVKNRDYTRIPDRSPVIAGDAVHCRFCKGCLCPQIAKKVDGWHILNFVHCSL